MRDYPTQPKDSTGAHTLVEGIENQVKEALGGAANDVVVQFARGGGAENKSNVNVTVEEINIHVHNDD